MILKTKILLYDVTKFTDREEKSFLFITCSGRKCIQSPASAVSEMYLVLREKSVTCILKAVMK
jgi:hypothetical protein